MNITRSLQKWGNGTGVRLPKKVIEAAHLQLHQELQVTLRGGSIVLSPLPPSLETTALTDLLKGVTPKDIGGELEWGVDIGAERYE